MIGRQHLRLEGDGAGVESESGDSRRQGKQDENARFTATEFAQQSSQEQSQEESRRRCNWTVNSAWRVLIVLY